jgi:hypothetical protein
VIKRGLRSYLKKERGHRSSKVLQKAAKRLKYRENHLGLRRSIPAVLVLLPYQPIITVGARAPLVAIENVKFVA